jgi:predicted RNase H-like HicB family nuclease
VNGDGHRIAAGLEEGADGAFLAHALTLPGCTAAGRTAEAAAGALQDEIVEWLRFLAASGEPVPPPDAELEIAVDEWLRTEARAGAGESTVCFAHDLQPLDDADTGRQLRWLGGLRGALLAHVRRLPADQADRPLPGGGTVRRALEELARAQWWTLSRLGASPLGELPDRTVGRLDTAMALTVDHFSHLPEERRGLLLEIDGEEWTPRKVLRRMLWTEWSLGRVVAHALTEGSPQ